jgi:hypothetical protein
VQEVNKNRSLYQELNIRSVLNFIHRDAAGETPFLSANMKSRMIVENFSEGALSSAVISNRFFFCFRREGAAGGGVYEFVLRL